MHRSPLPPHSARHRSRCGLLLTEQGTVLPSVDGEKVQLARGWRSEQDGQRRRPPPRRVMEKNRGGGRGKRVAVDAGRASGGGVRGEGGAAHEGGRARAEGGRESALAKRSTKFLSPLHTF
jgi:hypothetical protein